MKIAEQSLRRKRSRLGFKSRKMLKDAEVPKRIGKIYIFDWIVQSTEDECILLILDG